MKDMIVWHTLMQGYPKPSEDEETEDSDGDLNLLAMITVADSL